MGLLKVLGIFLHQIEYYSGKTGFTGLGLHVGKPNKVFILLGQSQVLERCGSVHVFTKHRSIHAAHLHGVFTVLSRARMLLHVAAGRKHTYNKNRNL